MTKNQEASQVREQAVLPGVDEAVIAEAWRTWQQTGITSAKRAVSFFRHVEARLDKKV